MTQSPSKTAYILGAGASHGASFAKGDDDTSSPPVMKEFLAVSRKVAQRKRSVEDFYQPLADDYRAITGRVLWEETNLEESYGVVERAHSRLWKKPREFPGPDVSLEAFETWLYNEYLTSSERFWSLIVDTLQECVPSGIMCSYHDQLARRVKDHDVIISLNYDTILEQSLAAQRGWDPQYGYGGIRPHRRRDCLPLVFKPHGSLSWTWVAPFEGEREWSILVDERPEQSIRATIDDMRQCLVASKDTRGAIQLIKGVLEPDDEGTPTRRPPELACIAPTSTKNLHDHRVTQVFERVWRGVHEHIRTSDRIVIIGCSLNPADEDFRFMFRSSVLNNTSCACPEVHIVGGDDVRGTLGELFYSNSEVLAKVQHKAGTLAQFVDSWQA